MGDKPEVGIVILNWNSYKFTANCLDSFSKLGTSYTVVVVDNGSSDNSTDQLEQTFPEVTLIKSSTNLGFAGGNNLGLKYFLDRGYHYLMLLNNDTLFENDFIAPMLAYMQANSEIGIIQPKILFNHDRSVIWNAGTRYYPFLGKTTTIGEGKSDKNTDEQIKTIPWASGCCMLMRREAIEVAGLLDEQFFIYHEDVDLSFRIRNLGYRVEYFPISKIFHVGGVSQKLDKSSRGGYLKPTFHYLNTRNKLFIARKYSKWYHIPSTAIYFFVSTCLFIGYFLVRLRFQKAKMMIKGISDGLTTNLKL